MTCRTDNLISDRTRTEGYINWAIFVANRLMLLFFLLIIFHSTLSAQPLPEANEGLHFDTLTTRWDEAIPLGNGIIGGLVYNKNGKLRIALDRADLWDLRPVKEFSSPDFNFRFVYDQVVNKKDMNVVHKLLDEPYDRDPAPTKIPAGALEFNIASLGKIRSVDLDIATATSYITWENGAKATIFIDANRPVGWFRFENLPAAIVPLLDAPKYGSAAREDKSQGFSGGQDLRRLGYPAGVVTKGDHFINFHQQAWGELSYDIAEKWKRISAVSIEGAFSVTAKNTPYSTPASALENVSAALQRGFQKNWQEHIAWWKNYWLASAIRIPDSILQHQWYMEQYKFGAVSRKGAPPIDLQGIWTADNGSIPPWKGDYHNDLNTELSYWPGYSSNHLSESAAFTDWLWKIKPVAEKYTRQYFGVKGLDVPGVCTLTGMPMGGWEQYSMSLTTGAWLGRFFYLQWKYTVDENFLRTRAYPWIKEVAVFFDNISVTDSTGKRKLPLSSSPEINDDGINAWFRQTTNFDLAMIKFTYRTAYEMAEKLGLAKEAKHWQGQLALWPDYALDPADSSLLVAPGYPLNFSHRHFSNMVAFHPLGMLDLSQGAPAKKIIEASLANLNKYGSGQWCGYSFAWLGNMKARAFDGEGADSALRIFATAFCSPNSFHLNGDQSGRGYSKFTYRPFTLEGNFAFAACVQEMLLQSHTGVVYLFPAVPGTWKEASFENLRAQGAFLVSAVLKNGLVENLKIISLKGGELRLKNPFKGRKAIGEGISLSAASLRQQDIIVIPTRVGERFMITSR